MASQLMLAAISCYFTDPFPLHMLLATSAGSKQQDVEENYSTRKATPALAGAAHYLKGCRLDSQ